MKLIEEKTIKIGDVDYKIKMSIRAMIQFEKLSGHSISILTTTEDIIMLFYCTIKAGGLDVSYDEFLDMIDDKPECIESFSNAFIEPTEKKKPVR